MKSLIFCIALTLFSLSISLGYDISETPQFISDLKLMVSMSEKVAAREVTAENIDSGDAYRYASVSSYLKGSITRKKYNVMLYQSSSFEYFSDRIFKADSVKEKSDIAKEGLAWSEQLELKTFGYKMPDTSPLVVAKVLVKFAEDNPASLVESPIAFMDMAFKDAWGEKE